MSLFDFANSYLTLTVPDRSNTARIQLDARCVPTDQRTVQTEEFVLITPCKSRGCTSQQGFFRTPITTFAASGQRGSMLSFAPIRRMSQGVRANGRQVRMP